MYLALVIEGVPFVHHAIDLHLRKRYKRTRVFVNPFVKHEQRRGTEGGKGWSQEIHFATSPLNLVVTKKKKEEMCDSSPSSLSSWMAL